MRCNKNDYAQDSKHLYMALSFPICCRYVLGLYNPPLYSHLLTKKKKKKKKGKKWLLCRIRSKFWFGILHRIYCKLTSHYIDWLWIFQLRILTHDTLSPFRMLKPQRHESIPRQWFGILLKMVSGKHNCTFFLLFDKSDVHLYWYFSRCYEWRGSAFWTSDEKDISYHNVL